MIICPLCGKPVKSDERPEMVNLRSTYSDGDYYGLVSCDCGTLITFPQPTISKLKQIYLNSYAYGLHVLLSWEKRFRGRDLLCQIKLNFTSVCDLGCGDGSLLLEAKKLGFKTSGCELDENSARKANERLGGNAIKTGTIESYLAQVTMLPDLVVMSHSLEHLLNPGDTLSKILSLMPEGGLILFALPNADVGRRSLLRKSWGYWQVPVHTVHFGAKSFSQFLREAGFRFRSIRFRSFDFLTLGSTILNFLRIRSVKFGSKPSALLRATLPIASRIWSIGLGAGKSEMLILVQKPE